MSNVPPPSDLPPVSPPPPPPPPPPGLPVDPAKQVQAPAYGLMGAAAIFVLVDLYFIVSAIFGLSMGAMGGQGRMGLLFSGIGHILWIVINLALAGLIFYGASQMLKLRNYNLALAAAIAALLPCTYCCCVLNLAMGIWAMVILLKPEVKAAFTNGPGGFPTV